VKAVILAGGEGTRLRPYTVSLPKPLMPVGDHPILEIVIKQLKKAGVSKVIIAVGYLESLIRAFFNNGRKYGIEIVYSSENKPMGTAGPLRLIKSELNETFILVNGDILTDIDFNSMIEFHKKEGALATVAVTRRKINVDFGVIKFDTGNRITGWNEKPSLEYQVSMGIYIFEPRVLEFIPDGFYNVPDLIMSLHHADEKIKGYLHDGFWLDIGRVEDYQKACQLVESGEINFDAV
jgi:NDP-sugar pyrophosphorylase family protein